MAAHRPAHVHVHKVAYLLALGATYYTIVDLEYPRWGLVTINPAVNVALEELGRRMM